MTNHSDIRWKQRLQNFENALQLLTDALSDGIDALNSLEKEGAIQRFENTLELAWKVLKDKMTDDGLLLDQFSPKAVIRKAFGAKYIDDGDVWIQMVGDRNLLSHTYNFETFEKVLQRIENTYLPILTQLHRSLKEVTSCHCNIPNIAISSAAKKRFPQRFPLGRDSGRNRQTGIGMTV